MKNKTPILGILFFSFNVFAITDFRSFRATKTSGTVTAVNGGWSVTKVPNVKVNFCHLNLERAADGANIFARLNFQVLDSYSNIGSMITIGEGRVLRSVGMAILNNGTVEFKQLNNEIRYEGFYKNGILSYRSIIISTNPIFGNKISELEIQEFRANVSPDFEQISDVQLEWKLVKPKFGFPVFISNDLDEILRSNSSVSEGVVDCSQWQQR